MRETSSSPGDGKTIRSFQPTSRQLLRALENMANIGFCTLGFADGKVHCSDGVHIMAGTLDRANRPVDLAFIEAHTHPDDRAELIESFRLLMRGLVPSSRKLRLLRGDGTIRNLEMRFERLMDDQLRPTGWLICVMDRSEIESLREALASNRHRLATVFTRLDADMAWFASPQSQFIEPIALNPKLHSPPMHLGPEGWLPLIHPDDREMALDSWISEDRRGQPLRITFDGETYLPMQISAFPVEDEKGNSVEWLGLASFLVQKTVSARSRDENGADLLTGPLLRGARNLLRWTIPVLADRSGISTSTIMRLEDSALPIGTIARRSTLDRLMEALVEGGVAFHRTMAGKLAISL